MGKRSVLIYFKSATRSVMKMSLEKISSIILCSCVALFSIQCKPPWEWKPDHEETYPAPEPPKLTAPLPETTIYYAITPSVEFNWEILKDTEYYELNIDTTSHFTTDPSFPHRINVSAASSPITISNFVRREMHRKYYCRIRAVSKMWNEGYTNWSATRGFVLSYVPGD